MFDTATQRLKIGFHWKVSCDTLYNEQISSAGAHNASFSVYAFPGFEALQETASMGQD